MKPPNTTLAIPLVATVATASEYLPSLQAVYISGASNASMKATPTSLLCVARLAVAPTAAPATPPTIAPTVVAVKTLAVVVVAVDPLASVKNS